LRISRDGRALEETENQSLKKDVSRILT
jgi:hypothetical protein